MMGKYTKGPWRVGKGGCVVADHPVPEMRGSEHTDYYGGYLIAESVTPSNARVAASAPELPETLRSLMGNPQVQLGDLVYQVREREGAGWEGPAVVSWGEAVAKAEELLKRLSDLTPQKSE